MGLPPVQGLNRRIHNHTCPRCKCNIPNPTKAARNWNGYCGTCFRWLEQNSNILDVTMGKQGDQQ